MPQKSLFEIAVHVATRYIANNKGLTELPLQDVLLPIYRAVLELHHIELSGNSNTTVSKGPTDPHTSIRRNEVLCLECGKTFKLLSNRHTALHNLTPRQYKEKHGIRLTQALSARTLSAKRRKLAKASGLEKQLAAWRADRKRRA